MTIPTIHIIGDPAWLTTPDLADLACRFSELATTLRLIGKGLGDAYVDAIGALDEPGRHHMARATALRTAKKAMIDLAGVIGEIEIIQAREARR